MQPGAPKIVEVVREQLSHEGGLRGSGSVWKRDGLNAWREIS